MKPQIVFVEASVTGAGELANRFAREAGLHVTLLSRDPASYSEQLRRYADEVLMCETNDVKELARVVRELHARHPVQGVTTTADFYVPQAAYVAHSLGLPGLDYEAALSVRNKYRMRVRLQSRCPELNPRFCLVMDREEALRTASEWGLPLIAKPQDANDGLNVRLIHSLDELSHYMAEAREWTVNSAGQPFARGVLLEEFVEGTEFSIETLQPKGGPLRLIGVTTKELIGLERRHFVELSHSFPVRTAEAGILFAATAQALGQLGIDCGVIHTECRIRDGQVKVMEVNPRLAGGKIGSHLVELAVGENPLRAVIDIALGRNVDWQPRREGGAALHFIPSAEQALFRGLANPEEVMAMPGVVDFLPLVAPGTAVRPPESNGDMVAMVIAQGATEPEALERVRAAAKKARLLLEPSPLQGRPGTLKPA